MKWESRGRRREIINPKSGDIWEAGIEGAGRKGAGREGREINEQDESCEQAQVPERESREREPCSQAL